MAMRNIIGNEISYNIPGNHFPKKIQKIVQKFQRLIKKLQVLITSNEELKQFNEFTVHQHYWQLGDSENNIVIDPSMQYYKA